MINVKLNYLRSLRGEVNRLEEIYEQMSKCRNPEKKKNYYENLKLCREELEELKSKGMLESLDLGIQMEMAKNYYYKGMKWDSAFENSNLFQDFWNRYKKEKRIVDDRDVDVDSDSYKKQFGRYVRTNEKKIIRTVQESYKYWKREGK